MLAAGRRDLAKTETVRLNSPAVISSKSISFFCKSRWRFGTGATTPIEPTTANGAATMRSAAQAIM